MACFADLQLLIGNLFGHLTLERGQRFPFQIISHRSLPVCLFILKIIWILPFTPLVLTSPLKLISHCPCSPSFLFLVFLFFFLLQTQRAPSSKTSPSEQLSVIRCHYLCVSHYHLSPDLLE